MSKAPVIGPVVSGIGQMVGGILGLTPPPQGPAPVMAAPPPSPTADNAEVQKDLSAAQEAERKAKGRASTLLSSSGGGSVDDSNLSVSRRTLMGS